MYNLAPPNKNACMVLQYNLVLSLIPHTRFSKTLQNLVTRLVSEENFAEKAYTAKHCHLTLGSDKLESKQKHTEQPLRAVEGIFLQTTQNQIKKVMME